MQMIKLTYLSSMLMARNAPLNIYSLVHKYCLIWVILIVTQALQAFLLCWSSGRTEEAHHEQWMIFPRVFAIIKFKCVVTCNPKSNENSQMPSAWNSKTGLISLALTSSCAWLRDQLPQGYEYWAIECLFHSCSGLGAAHLWRRWKVTWTGKLNNIQLYFMYSGHSF